MNDYYNIFYYIGNSIGTIFAGILQISNGICLLIITINIIRIRRDHTKLLQKKETENQEEIINQLKQQNDTLLKLLNATNADKQQD